MTFAGYRILLLGYIVCNIESYVFRGCFRYNSTVFMEYAEYAKYIPANLSASSCSFVCQTKLNLTTPFALAEQNMCYCGKVKNISKQLGRIDNLLCRNYCQRSMNDTIYCGRFGAVALYEVPVDGEEVPEPPVECNPLDGPINGKVRYEEGGFAIVECNDGYFPFSHNILQCQFLNGTYSWNGTLPLCLIGNTTFDELGNADDSKTAVVVIVVVCGVLLLSVAVGVAYFFIMKTRSSSFKIHHHRKRSLRPRIERVDGDGTHNPHTGRNAYEAQSIQEQIGLPPEGIPLEPEPPQEHKDGYDHLPKMTLSSRECATDTANEHILDRNGPNRSTYNYVTPQSTHCDDENHEEEYDLPTMDSSPYQESYFEFTEGMTSMQQSEPDPESTQIPMNIDMTMIHAPGYSRVSKPGKEDREEYMEEAVQDLQEEEEEGPEEFYLEPNL